MDLTAVVALVIVLRDYLPVGRNVVAVLRHDEQPFCLVVLDQFAELADVGRKTRRVAGDVYEDPSLPLPHPCFHEVVRGIAAIETRLRRETGPPFEGSVERIGPAMVRAPDHGPAHRLVAAAE